MRAACVCVGCAKRGPVLAMQGNDYSRLDAYIQGAVVRAFAQEHVTSEMVKTLAVGDASLLSTYLRANGHASFAVAPGDTADDRREDDARVVRTKVLLRVVFPSDQVTPSMIDIRDTLTSTLAADDESLTFQQVQVLCRTDARKEDQAKPPWHPPGYSKLLCRCGWPGREARVVVVVVRVCACVRVCAGVGAVRVRTRGDGRGRDRAGEDVPCVRTAAAMPQLLRTP